MPSLKGVLAHRCPRLFAMGYLHDSPKCIGDECAWYMEECVSDDPLSFIPICAVRFAAVMLQQLEASKATAEQE